MKLSLIGDHRALPEIIADLKSHGHVVSEAWGLCDAHREALGEVYPAAACPADWSSQLDAGCSDVVAVFGAAEATLDAVRKLATHGRPILLAPDYDQGLGFIYELSLIHDDNNVALLPWCPERFDPHVLSLREHLGTGAIGKPLLIEWNRRVRTDSGRLVAAECDRQLLADVDLLRQIGGDYNQVTALQTRTGDEALVKASVTLAAADCPDASWTIVPDANEDAWSLVIRGESGSITLSGSSVGPHSLVVNGETIPSVAHESERGWGRAVSALERMGIEKWIGWDQLTRNFETVDATRISLRKRRTIDLYFETASELSQFKTQMTAIGCGVLTFTLFALVAYLTLASIFPLPRTVLNVLRILWLLPLVVFLCLQLLVVLARPARRGDNDDSTD